MSVRLSSETRLVTPCAPSARPPAPRYGSDHDHLLDRLAVVARYRRIAFAVFALTAGAIMIQAYSQIAMFQAQARLLIEDERSTAMPGITNVEAMYWQDPEPYYNTQYRILRGRDLTRRVAQAVEPAGRRGVQRHRSAAVQSFRHRPSARRQGAWRSSGRRRRFRSSRLVPTRSADEAALVGAFIGRVQVAPVTGSRLVDVYFQSTDPRFAANAANALVDEYVSQNLEVKLQSTQNMLEWLDKELSTQQQKVEDSERALAEYRDRENAMSLDDKNNIVLSRLTALNDALVKARTTRIEKDAVYSQVKTVSDLARPSRFRSCRRTRRFRRSSCISRICSARRRSSRERYGDRHPEMVKINRQPGRCATSARSRNEPDRCSRSRTSTTARCSKSARSRRTSSRPRPTSRISAARASPTT